MANTNTAVAEAQEKFRATVKQLDATYLKLQQPARDTYLAATAAPHETYREALAEASEAFQRARDAALEVYQAATAGAAEVYQAAVQPYTDQYGRLYTEARDECDAAIVCAYQATEQEAVSV